MALRHTANAAGDWYVDDPCIDCAATRTVAPGLIVRKGSQSDYARPPATAAEQEMVQRAAVVCPTASVRTGSRQRIPPNL